MECLVQACCHPQVVRKDDSLMGGSERLSMLDIMARLVGRAFHDYDAALQRVIKAHMMLAAVLWHLGLEGESQL